MSSPRRAGYVAILGRPNVGKSTLLNRILGEKLSITSPKPQTTRRRIAGIHTRPEAQIVFVDTPGLLEPAYALQRALVAEVREALAGVDLVYLVADGRAGAAPNEDRKLVTAASTTPIFLVLNKTDRMPAGERKRLVANAAASGVFAEIHAVSALTGSGVEALLVATVERLPPGEFFFDPEQLTDRSLRFLAAELVRETLYEVLEEELPYASHVEVTAYDESPRVPRIEAVIYVERESQKGIVIGHEGATLKRIGTAARAKIEGLAGTRVFLQLRVKVRHNWRRNEVELRRFGYRPHGSHPRRRGPASGRRPS